MGLDTLGRIISSSSSYETILVSDYIIAFGIKAKIGSRSNVIEDNSVCIVNI